MSGSGKTTIALGLMLALINRGFNVKPFKIGPDFIDPTLHRQVCGVPSRNLDTWLLPPKLIPEIFSVNATGRRTIAIIEGVMGLYDGLDGASEMASTAQVAKLLRCPVVLTVDADRMARSAAAVALGFRKFDSKVNVAAVILNKVGGTKHAAMCKDAIEETGITVIGSIPYDKSIILPERHMGLVPAPEHKLSDSLLSKLANTIENFVNVPQLVEIASRSGQLPNPPRREHRHKKPRVKLGVAYDAAFNFYYEDALDFLRHLGADLKFFSPMNDEGLPDVSGLYIGGGFPEIYAAQLERNIGMRKAILQSAESDMPIYAECGGFMYLSKSLTTLQGRKHMMVGALPAETAMKGRLTLNYTEGLTTRAHPFMKHGRRVRGQEFHYSAITNVPRNIRFAYELSTGRGIHDGSDGITQHYTLGSYMHAHLLGCRELAKGFIEACYGYSKS